MALASIDIRGMPYFPGLAAGRLHRGAEADSAGGILLIAQRDIPTLACLPAGLIVVDAAPLSHTMIGLLGLGVPTVLITAAQAASLRDEVELVIDGVSGRITNDTSVLEQMPADVQGRPGRVAGQAVSMSDGETVRLLASVRSAVAARQAVEKGARGIGLVRSEYLLPTDGSIPDAAFYRAAFRVLSEAAMPLPVTFRLLDTAADKMPAWLQQEAGGSVSGLQGLRLYGQDSVRRVIDAQLTAIAGLAQDFDIRLIIPFLTRLEEFEYWLAWIRQALPDTVPVGAMAETPASVLDISLLLERADFVAIGCNDLMQSLYAADRDQAELRHYLDPYAPVLFRLFLQMSEQAGGEMHRVQLCGVLPQIQGVLPVLLGLGYRDFSVDAPFIPYLADTVRRCTQEDCRSLAERVCAARTTEEVLEVLALPKDRHPPFLY